MEISIRNIRLDGGLQIRTDMDSQVVKEYAGLMDKEGGNPLPPIQVVKDGDNYWLVDGFHRVYAARAAGKDTIEAEVLEGDLNQAAWLAVAANKTHGLRRTQADKVNAVKMALSRWPGQSDRRLADHIGVDHKTVGKYRKGLEPSVEADESEEDSQEEEGVGNSPPAPTKADPEDADAGDAEPEEDPKFFDEVGAEIPEHLLEIWQKQYDTEEKIKTLREVRLYYRKLEGEDDKYHATFNLQRITTDIGNAVRAMKAEIPYAVCIHCGGDGCHGCNGRGFLGKVNYEMAPADLKETMGLK